MKNRYTANTMRWISRICGFLLILLMWLPITFHAVSSEPIDESIIYVDKKNPEYFLTIQDGIDAAKTGNTIFVYNGTYYENIVIDKSIALIGENTLRTIIDGRETGNVIKINANNVTIKGFTIQHSGLFFPNSGINVSSDYNSIEDNEIINNFYGMTLHRSSNNSIRNNLFQNDDSCGIYMSRSSNNTIRNNTIQNNRYNGIGVYDFSDSNVIEYNIFTHNNYCGINIRNSSYNNIIKNNFSENNIGIHLPNPDTNIVQDNTFLNNDIDIDKELFFRDNEFFIIAVIFILAIILLIFFLKKKEKKR